MTTTDLIPLTLTYDEYWQAVLDDRDARTVVDEFELVANERNIDEWLGHAEEAARVEGTGHHVRALEELYAAAVAVAADIINALADIAEFTSTPDGQIRCNGLVPDSGEYFNDMAPGGDWDDACEALQEDVQSRLPSGWTADWSDEDMIVSRVDEC